MSDHPTLWLVAGPDGVGKTTYAFRHVRAVSGSAHFVNLDEIARGLSPLAPELAQRAAARIALQRIDTLITEKASLTLETTLSGLTHLRTIEMAKRKGLRVNLLFFSIPRVEQGIARVARRVSEGGHDVPENDIRRRYTRAMQNFPKYAAQVNLWRIFDNSGIRPVVAAEGRAGCRSMLGDMEGLPYVLKTTVKAMPECLEESL